MESLILKKIPFKKLNFNMNKPTISPDMEQKVTPQSKTASYLLCALVIIQCLYLLFYSWTYFEIVRTGSVRPLALYFGMASNFFLYLATALFLSKKRAGKILFLLAAIGLGITAYAFGLQWGWARPLLLGCGLACWAWWIYDRATAQAQ